MSLPEITAPAGTPAFQTEQGIEAVPVFGGVKMRAGHSRTRRIFTIAPRTITVRWFLTSAQMAEVHAWFEQVLLVGHREFAAPVKKQGASILWWSAKWVAPYRSVPAGNGWWRVDGSLRVTGSGSATGPVASTLSADFSVALGGEASLTVTKGLTVSFSAALTDSANLHVSFTAALLSNVASGGSMLREDGFHILREDGSRILRET